MPSRVSGRRSSTSSGSRAMNAMLRVVCYEPMPRGRQQRKRDARSAAGGDATALVLVHDRGRIAVRELMLVAQPRHAFVDAEERRAVLDFLEPLGEMSPRHIRNPRQETLVGLFGVLVRHWCLP